MALDMISREKAGVVIYEQQEGRGIGLLAKLRAYELQDKGFDTVEANEMLGFQADCRQYQLSVGVLQALGLTRIRLLSNNPAKMAAVEKAGIEIVERVPCEVPAGKLAEHYLRTKKQKLGHLFSAFD
jgi:GTP cyclohydrolase II